MLKDASFVIWTTTPWTLPANLALSVNPEFSYHLVKSKWGKLVIAEDLLESFAKLVMNEEEFAEYMVIGSTDDFEASASS
jgi:isoleucyl-tRNA synthetase